MKKIVQILSVIFISSICLAQVENDTYADSLALVSRNKADMVLDEIASPSLPKILYSLNNKDFYVIVKDDCKYQEFYISMDSSNNFLKKRSKRSKRKDRKLFAKSFKYENYHSKLITNMPNAKFVRGKQSYFVIKDSNSKRYGEYNLSALTLPSPLDKDLFAFLAKKLSEEIIKKP